MSKEVASVKQPICRVQIVLNFNYFWWCHSHIAKSNEAVGGRVLLEQATCETVSLYRYHKIRGWYNYCFYSFKDTGRPKEDNSLSVISQY